MKKALGLTLALAINLFILSQLIGQYNWGNGRGITGEGSSISRDLNLDNFSGIKLSLAGNVYIRQGATQSVRVEGQANVIDKLSTEVSEGVWRIGFRDPVRNYTKLDIYITIPKLTEAWVSGSGNINGETPFDNIDKFDTGVSGSGNIRLNVAANVVTAKISGSGNIDLSGNAAECQAIISGSGAIDAEDLEAQDVMATVSGSGDCEVTARRSLKATVSGSGDIFYRGNPSQVQSRASGSGDIEARN
jgi:hypothetical protein